ncbi:MAG TPA: YkvA family protein [Candidatus Limnocylindrales bacterium]|nr:YkvA family protein [Candidatus Limnocylindrales bacterium]
MARGIKRPRNMGEAIEVARKLPTYARLVWGLARDPRVPTQQKLVLGAIAAYLAFPIDIVPDFIPVIGQMDDVAVLLLGLDWFIRNAPEEVVEEHMARISQDADVFSKDFDSASTMLKDRAAELRATLERMRSKREGGDQS